MAVVTVAERIEAPAQRVWDYISWNGVNRLAGGLFKRIEYFGDEPVVGVIKRIHLAEGLPVLERLEAVDETDFTYRYQVIDSGDMPVTDYRGYVRVTPCGPDACNLKIECTYTAVGVSDEEWAEIWGTMETGLIAEIKTKLAA